MEKPTHSLSLNYLATTMNSPAGRDKITRELRLYCQQFNEYVESITATLHLLSDLEVTLTFHWEGHELFHSVEDHKVHNDLAESIFTHISKNAFDKHEIIIDLLYTDEQLEKQLRQSINEEYGIYDMMEALNLLLDFYYKMIYAWDRVWATRYDQFVMCRVETDASKFDNLASKSIRERGYMEYAPLFDDTLWEGWDK